MEMKQSEYKEASVKGNYMGECCICKSTIINADKRCYSCEECDEKLYKQQQNEVIEILEFIKAMTEYTNIVDEFEDKELTIQQQKESEALTEAIRCVELLPELVEALEYCNDRWVTHQDDKIDELLKKAKGLSK
jgi:hypothetical protein